MSYSLRVFESIHSVPAADWDCCVDDQVHLSHSFLLVLETTLDLKQQGVVPGYFLLYQNGTPVGCMPLVFKWGTKREFGPEAYWLKLAELLGKKVWPKLQIEIPLFPIPSAKPIVRSGCNSNAVRNRLMQGLFTLAAKRKLSVVNIMHVSIDSLDLELDVISEESVSVWRNEGWLSYDSYVAGLSKSLRYRMRKEKERLLEQGVYTGFILGSKVSDAFLKSFYKGYRSVCSKYGSQSIFSFEFFYQTSRILGDKACFFYAEKNGLLQAAIFGLKNKNSLYLHQWSCSSEAGDLVFDLVCYQPIKYAIEEGIEVVYAGPAAEYKEFRGYKRESLYNLHYLSDVKMKELANSVIGR